MATADKITISAEWQDHASKGVQQMRRQMDRELGQLNNRLRDVERMATMATLALAGMATGLAAAYAGFGKSVIGVGAQMETFQVQLEVLLGSEEAAIERLDELSQFAATVPFELPGVIAAAQQLENFGIYSEKYLRAVANAAAFADTSMEQMANTLGRLAAGGFGEAFERLREMGIATRPMLEAEGLRFDRGGAYVGSVEQAMNVVIRIIERRFLGMTERLAETWPGLLSMLADAWTQFRKKIAKAGFFEEVKGQVEGVLDEIRRLEEQGDLQRWAGMLSDAFSDAVRAITGFQGRLDEVAIDRIVTGMSNFIREAGEFLGKLRELATGTITWAAEHQSLLITLAEISVITLITSKLIRLGGALEGIVISAAGAKGGLSGLLSIGGLGVGGLVGGAAAGMGAVATLGYMKWLDQFDVLREEMRQKMETAHEELKRIAEREDIEVRWIDPGLVKANLGQIEKMMGDFIAAQEKLAKDAELSITGIEMIPSGPELEVATSTLLGMGDTYAGVIPQLQAYADQLEQGIPLTIEQARAMEALNDQLGELRQKTKDAKAPTVDTEALRHNAETQVQIALEIYRREQEIRSMSLADQKRALEEQLMVVQGYGEEQIRARIQIGQKLIQVEMETTELLKRVWQQVERAQPRIIVRPEVLLGELMMEDMKRINQEAEDLNEKWERQEKLVHTAHWAIDEMLRSLRGVSEELDVIADLWGAFMQGFQATGDPLIGVAMAVWESGLSPNRLIIEALFGQSDAAEQAAAAHEELTRRLEDARSATGEFAQKLMEMTYAGLEQQKAALEAQVQTAADYKRKMKESARIGREYPPDVVLRIEAAYDTAVAQLEQVTQRIKNFGKPTLEMFVGAWDYIQHQISLLNIEDPTAKLDLYKKHLETFVKWSQDAAQIMTQPGAEMTERDLWRLQETVADLQRQIREAETKAEIEAIKEASQQRLQAIRDSYDLEKTILQEETRARFRMEEMALRQRYAALWEQAGPDLNRQMQLKRMYEAELETLSIREVSQGKYALDVLYDQFQAQIQAEQENTDRQIAAIEANTAIEMDYWEKMLDSMKKMQEAWDQAKELAPRPPPIIPTEFIPERSPELIETIETEILVEPWRELSEYMQGLATDYFANLPKELIPWGDRFQLPDWSRSEQAVLDQALGLRIEAPFWTFSEQWVLREARTLRVQSPHWNMSEQWVLREAEAFRLRPPDWSLTKATVEREAQALRLRPPDWSTAQTAIGKETAGFRVQQPFAGIRIDGLQAAAAGFRFYQPFTGIRTETLQAAAAGFRFQQPFAGIHIDGLQAAAAGFRVQQPFAGVRIDGLQAAATGFRFQQPFAGVRIDGLQAAATGFHFQQPFTNIRTDLLQAAATGFRFYQPFAGVRIDGLQAEIAGFKIPNFAWPPIKSVDLSAFVMPLDIDQWDRKIHAIDLSNRVAPLTPELWRGSIHPVDLSTRVDFFREASWLSKIAPVDLGGYVKPLETDLWDQNIPDLIWPEIFQPWTPLTKTDLLVGLGLPVDGVEGLSEEEWARRYELAPGILAGGKPVVQIEHVFEGQVIFTVPAGMDTEQVESVAHGAILEDIQSKGPIWGAISRGFKI